MTGTVFLLPLAAFAMLVTSSAAVAGGGDAAANAAQLQIGARGFAQCTACHSVEAGKPNGVGPNLNGFFGKRAGTNAPGYAYSDAMKKYAAVWSDKTLDTFLTAPIKTVPGTKMTYRGNPDPVARAALIAYLKAKTGATKP